MMVIFNDFVPFVLFVEVSQGVVAVLVVDVVVAVEVDRSVVGRPGEEGKVAVPVAPDLTLEGTLLREEATH